MLTAHRALSLLREERLIAPTTLVDGSVRIIPAARRHHHYRVTPGSGPAYFLKQGIKDGDFGSVAHEAAILTGLHAGSESRFTPYAPRSFGYFPQDKVLITELFTEAVDLRSYHTPRAVRPHQLARELGSSLAALHQTPRSAIEALNLPYPVIHSPPWVLNLPKLKHRELSTVSRMSLDLVKTLQHYPRFSWHFNRIKEQWKADTVIHYDIKWDNILVSPDPLTDRAIRLKLIDWEFAGIGDRCWDLGGILHEYLLLWITPIASEISIDDLAALNAGRYSTAALRPAIRRFWHTYQSRMGIREPAAEAVLTRAVEFAAVRAVQTAFELAQNASQMPVVVPYLLQCALNILERPREAATSIFGLGQEEST